MLMDAPAASAIRSRLRHNELHAPAHLDAEVLSAIGRHHRADLLSAEEASLRLGLLQRMPIQRHHLPALLPDAWGYRHNLRLADALYAALADRLGIPILSTDRRLVAAVPQAEEPSSL
ncbi:type II toxin-antitoxin system VapC family toxin [Candidatus Poriferisodalis sp.]|uniref:type II toxin-antitoxin system VapC family toxin n=1 Tax=Candidatus Poriferisodalis sp. TaxID=3101277 RepID=UPI003B02B431